MPQTALLWKSRPLFISSTFLDMHAERDQLRVHVFLDLVERVRARCPPYVSPGADRRDAHVMTTGESGPLQHARRPLDC
jgi:hypothetical protein